MFGKIKQSFSLFPPRKPLIWAVNSSIAQSHYCISNDVKAELSRKFHGEMTLFASAFAKPMEIRARLFLFDKPIKYFVFLFTFCFYVCFSKVILFIYLFIYVIFIFYVYFLSTYRILYMQI